MPLYETVLIARQDITPNQVEALAAQAAEIITTGGGKVTKTEHWGLRRLAYRINKNRKGHYVLFNIDAPATALIEMERTLKLNEDVLRYLSVKIDEHEAGPSAVIRARTRSAEEGDAQ